MMEGRGRPWKIKLGYCMYLLLYEYDIDSNFC